MPVGPSGATRAIRTMIPAPCATVCLPLCRLRSVSVKPGSTALIRMAGNAFAYWMVSTLTAVFEAGYATPG